MSMKTWKVMGVAVAFAAMAVTGWAAPWMGHLNVYDAGVWPGGRSGNYGTAKYFLDEAAGDSIAVDFYVEIWPDGQPAGNFQVELFSNVNRRDYAKVFESAADANGPSSYYKTYPMTYVGAAPGRPQNLRFKVTVPVSKCGAYRATARFRVNGGAWQWHNAFQYENVAQRDLALVVSPKKVLGLSIYEANPLVVEATGGGTWNQRSTFEDFTDRDGDGYNPFNLDYVRDTLGFNTLWLMPIFPITQYRWDPVGNRWISNFSPGSPYATRNFFAVNEWLDDGNTQEGALEEFQYLVRKADEKGLNVFIDMALNHAGRDVAFGQGGVDLGLVPASQKSAWIRETRPAWCTRGSNPSVCDLHYREHAANAFEPALFAPADRLGEHQWWDANVDFFFGSYSSLGPKPGFCYDAAGGAQDERDVFYTDLDPAGGYDVEVENVWNYFAYIIPYWLRATGNGLDGIRADFAQGLPPQAWEYIINKTRQQKWDFVFLAEVLDPSEVLYRANRHFDLITTVDHYLYRSDTATMQDYAASLEREAATFGYNAALMHNGSSHDEIPNGNKWNMVARYAVAASTYGVPMVYMSQPLGIPYKVNFESAWSDIASYWNGADGSVATMYRRINQAREQNEALRSLRRWFLVRRGDGQPNPDIFAAARWNDVPGRDRNIVFVFAKLRDHVTGDTFAVPSAVPLDPATTYQCYNLTSANPGQGLWGAGRTGAEILANGLYVGFSGAYADAGLVQYLKLAPAGGTGPISSYGSMTVAGTFNGWNAGLNNMTLVTNYTWSCDLSVTNAVGVRFKFTANGAWAANWGESNQGDLVLPVTGQTAEGGAGDILIQGVLNGAYRFVFNEQTRAYSVERLGGSADSDGDGLPDEWELQYFGNLLQDGDGDPDGDGKRNMTEYLAGWDPTVPDLLSSYTNVSVVGTFNGWNLALRNLALVSDYTWRGVLAVTNAPAVRFKFVANGGWAVNWGESNQADKDLPITEQVAESGNAPDILVNGTLHGNVRFTFHEQTRAYTVELVIVDTDGDTLPDDWEVRYFGSLAQGAGDDPDGDGRSNAQEYLAGTDPTVRAYASLHAAMTVAGTFNGWNAALGNMRLAGDHLWEADLTLTNATAVRFKFAANGGWGTNFGVAGQAEFTPNFTGVCAAANNAGDILVQSAMTGTYRFRFHELTRAYSVEKIAGAFTTGYGRLGVVGTFNGWNLAQTNLQLVADATWRGNVSVTNAAAARYKFVANGSWAANWGEQNQTEFGVPQAGTAEAGNYGDILVTPVLNGSYVFTFNEATRRYTLAPAF